MSVEAKKILYTLLGFVTAIVAFDSVYLLGYGHGSRDALNWDFSAVVEGKMVKLGKGSELMRSKEEYEPIRIINAVPSMVNFSKGQR